MRLYHSIFFVLYSLFILCSCSVSKQISKQANKILINDTVISKGHIGISIYEPATGKYWYNHDADKYFIPSSNTKLFTLYAGMKYLGDSLVGLKYKIGNNNTYIDFTADPTFLHPAFNKQPVLEFLLKQNNISINRAYPHFYSYGQGWSWEDYTENFMIPRSLSPVYGGQVKINWINNDSISIIPKYFNKYIDPATKFSDGFAITRQLGNNDLLFFNGEEKNKTIPFEADLLTVTSLLQDTLKNKSISCNTNSSFSESAIIYSQPSDSLFKPMMFNSDNFFAEQTLLMVSNEKLGYMSDEDMIDTLLKTDLKDVPQKPRWVDGSGLSRYNLFTPMSFVYILDKMKTEFGMDRLKTILPTGGRGTLKNYFLNDSNFIYAKTGTISNNCALSGFLVTQKGKLLIFSFLVNGYQTGATPVRRSIENFLVGIRRKY